MIYFLLKSFYYKVEELRIFEDCHEYIGQTFDLKQSDFLMKSGLYLKYVRK